MRKIIGIFIIVSLCLLSIFPIYAFDNSDIEKKEKSLKIENDLALLEDIGFRTDMVKKSKSASDRFINDIPVYDIAFDDGLINQVQIQKDNTGEIVLDFYENEIHDVIILKSDGSIIVNDKKIIVEDIDVIKQEVEIQANGRTSIFSKTPQRGVAADYTKKEPSYSKNVYAGQKIKNLSIGAIVTLLAKPLNLGSYSNVISAVAANMKSAAEVYAPDSAYFSYLVNVSAYKNNTTVDKFFKHAGKYYVKKDCTGHYEKSTFYEYNFIQ